MINVTTGGIRNSPRSSKISEIGGGGGLGREGIYILTMYERNDSIHPRGFDRRTGLTRAFISSGYSTLGSRAAENIGCKWGIQFD